MMINTRNFLKNKWFLCIFIVDFYDLVKKSSKEKSARNQFYLMGEVHVLRDTVNKDLKL